MCRRLARRPRSDLRRACRERRHPTPATTRSIANASSRNIIRGRRSRSRRPVPAVRRRRRASTIVQGRARLAPPPSEPANRPPLPPAMAGSVLGQPLRKRLVIDDDPFGPVGDYVGSFLVEVRRRSLGRLRHQSRPPRGAARLAVLHDRAGISGGVELGASRCGRRPARLLHRLRQQSDAEPSTARRCRRRSTSTGRILSAISTAVSTSSQTRACWGRGGCLSRPTIPAARTFRRALRAIRSTPRSAAPSASTRTSIACSSPAAPRSIAPTISGPSSPTAP